MLVDSFRSSLRIMPVVVLNIVLSFALFSLTRIIYYLDNHTLFGLLSLSEAWLACRGGWLFDAAAVAYINLPYLLMMLVPFKFREGGLYQNLAMWVFVIVNGVAQILNIADSAYYPFIKRRTTFEFFTTIDNDDNIWEVIYDGAIDSWYLVVAIVAIIFVLFKFYQKPKGSFNRRESRGYYILNSAFLLLGCGLTVVAMRGGIALDLRPIKINIASEFVKKQTHTAIVLNTPFSLLRTMGKPSFHDPKYFSTEELNAIFTPEKEAPTQPQSPKAKNVVVLILESFGKEYIGSLNGDEKPTYTPFLDSLIDHSLTYDHSFANGTISIDAMPSILSSIPMFMKPYFTTTSSTNSVSGLADYLGNEGFQTGFFHGATNGSMGFQAFANATKFQKYYGRREYGDDSQFDGRWAIWDEEFLQYFSCELNNFHQPFAVALFTATSHHPFNVPKRYEGRFDEGTLPIHHCVGYTDNALRHFFATASQQEWFDSTLFVLTADHTSLTSYPEEFNSLNFFKIPIIFYQPNSDLRGRSQKIAQQIDILPTVLNYLGYKKPHLSFGCDLFTTPSEECYCVNYYNNLYQYFQGDFMLQFDGKKSVALYNFKNDSILRNNLLEEFPSEAKTMEQKLKAIIQQYMFRMEHNKLIISPKISD